MQKTTLICEGKSKKLFATEDPDLAVLEFADEAIAYEGFKRQTIRNKGVMNNRICERMFQLLEENGIHTHFIGRLSDREMLVHRLQILPIAIVVRNFAAGDLCERTGLPAGIKLPCTVVECRYKSNELNNPLINHTHIAAMGLATQDEMDCVRDIALKVNEVMGEFLKNVNIELIDFKLEFGRMARTGELVVGDEITPQNCRLWDSRTHEALDLDLFRHDLGDVQEGYQEIMQRVLGKQIKAGK